MEICMGIHTMLYMCRSQGKLLWQSILWSGRVPGLV